MPSDRTTLDPRVLQIPLVLIGATYAFVYFRGPWAAMRIAGLALAIPALLLWLVARIQLGTSFAVTPQARALVTHGVYARIRNPIYIFGSLFVAGLILYAGRPAWLLIFAVVIPMQWARARKEAAVLEEAFGDAYRAYRKRTWF